MKKTVIGAVALLGALTMNTAMAKETISIVGSNSASPLVEVLAETYMNKGEQVFIEIQAPGSSAGIRAAQDGSANLGISSRNLEDAEKSDDLKQLDIAHDGIAVVVNPNNSVKELTSEQISKIYKGEISNWKELGGEDKPIVAITRDTASGTRGAFEDIMKLKMEVSGKEVSAISQRAQVANGNGALKVSVANNPYAIGYISLGTVDDTVQPLVVDGAEATAENVKSGTYKLSRPFLMLYKDGSPSAETQKFLDWLVSEEAQEIVGKKGYITVH